MQNLDELIQRYESGTSELLTLFNDVASEYWDQRPIEDQWTIRELICHLADAELIYADRMKRVLVEDNPLLRELVPEDFVPLSRGRHLPTELEFMTKLREQMVSILKNCELEDFQRTGVHSAEGPMTLETLLERITNHLPHHNQFLMQKLEALNITQ